MVDVILCRVCLSSGVKMFTSDQYQLRQVYEEITMKKMDTEAGLPHNFCYMCAALLYKFHKFKHKCLTAESMLYQLLEKGPIKSSTVIQNYGQYTHLDSPINMTKPSKNVKTCIVKSKYFIECEQPNVESIDNSKTMYITPNIEEPMICIPDAIKMEKAYLGDNEIIIKEEINDASNDDENSVKTNHSDNEEFTIQIDTNHVFFSESSGSKILPNIKIETDEKDYEQNLSNIKVDEVISNCVKREGHDEAMGPLVCRFCGMNYTQKCYTELKCLQCDFVCVTETAYNPTMADQPDEPMKTTHLSKSNVLTKAKVEDTDASTSATASTPKKSKAQKQKEYRQRMAASRTPAQLLADRKANAERQRKSRLRKAANSVIVSD